MVFSFYRTDKIVVSTNANNCTATSNSLGFGGAYTIIINEVRCCWMDNSSFHFNIL